jgi:amino acid transporter
VNHSNKRWVSSLRANSVTFVESIAQAVGTMAPSAGIAIVVPMVFAKAGNATWLVFFAILLTYLILAGVFRIFAIRSASAGGLGHFAELAFGRWGGILVSWLYIMTLIFTLTCPLVSAVYYVGVLVHDYNGCTPTGWWSMAIMVGMVTTAVTIVYLGIKFSSNFMLVVECVSMAGICFLAFDAFLRQPHWVDSAQLRQIDFRGANYSLAFATAFFCLTGFEAITALGAETKKAKQTIPRAILCCIVPIGLLYVGLSYVLVADFHRSPVELGQTLAPFEYISASLGLHWLGLAVSIGVVVSGFASVPACMNAAARVLFDLSKKGDFWQSFARVESRFGSPLLAILLIAVLSVAGPLFLFKAGASLS